MPWPKNVKLEVLAKKKHRKLRHAPASVKNDVWEILPLTSITKYIARDSVITKIG